ncbi:hypothetical protein FOZ60_014642 [Perkinsus olseni]|uniref:glutaminase n=1 Tax=Perkinsus olseni TaxID=32597 RepID=A0A7J6PMZ1_PEROL|nr:hypothetical protein FOZ60_014642 [Perkinsus olseni]
MTSSSSTSSRPLHGRGAPPMGPSKDTEESSHRPRSGSIGSPTNASRKDRIYNQEYEDAIANLEHRPVPDITVPWFYESHSLFVLIAAMALIYYYTIKHGADAEANGSSSDTALYLVVGLFAFPSGPFVRPHPGILEDSFRSQLPLSAGRRLGPVPHVLSSSGIYCTVWTPQWASGTPYPSTQRTVPSTWDNVKSKLDIFVIGHFFGWIVKGLLFRNRMFCWFFSVGWEFVEKSLGELRFVLVSWLCKAPSQEHCIVLSKLDLKGVKITPCEALGDVRTIAELNACDGLIIPGGESTAMKIISEGGEDDIIEGMRQFALSGRPIWGTCAGTILLAKTVCQSSRDASGAIVEHTECKYGNPIGVMDIRVSRNYFGRQLNSFEATIDEGCIFADVPAVFIRAPAILDVDPEKVTVLGKFGWEL